MITENGYSTFTADVTNIAQNNSTIINQDWITKWKVIMSYITYDHAGRADKDGKRRIFSTMEVLPPKVVCTETYIVVDTFNSEIEAKNLLQYLKTKFVRFLVAQVTTTQHILLSKVLVICFHYSLKVFINIVDKNAANTPIIHNA